MNKKITIGIIIAGLLLVATLAYFLIPSIVGNVIAPPGKISVIVPEVNVTPGTPQVIFIGVTTLPVDLAENQGVINNVVITFSEPMDSSTVNQDTFIVTGPNNANIKGVITSDSTKKIWTFDPTDTLKFNSVYSIRVTTGAKGISGNSLIKDFAWSFTTSYGGSSGGGSSGGGSGGDSNPSATPVLTSITLTPTSSHLTNGSTKQLTAASLDQSGNSIDAAINYTSSNSSIATVNISGFVTALTVGNATITASSGTVSNTSIIYVSILPTSCPAVTVDLGTAGDFVILSETGITTTGTTSIVGDIGVSPIDSTAITGFGLILDSSGTFSKSSLITGNVYAADYTEPTPTTMTTAIGDMGTAYTNANGLAFCVSELGDGNIGGLTLAPGVYKWGTDLTIPTDVTLSGSATDVWVFQVAGKLDIASGKQVILSGGAIPSNVYWIVSDTTTLGTTSVFNGNILDQTNIALQTGATLNGRALAQTAVTLDANPVTISD